MTGYKTNVGGADTVFPFKKELVKVGQVTSASATIDISHLSHKNLTDNDFIMAMVSCSAVLNTSRDVAGTLNLRPKLTYNNDTGIINVEGLSTYLSGWNGVSFTNSCVVDVYMVK